MLTLCNVCRQKIFSQQFRRTLYQTSTIWRAETDRKDPNSFSWRTHSCGELSPAQVGQSVTLCGWIQHKRYDFMVTLRDAYGVTQVVLPKEDQNKLSNKMDSFEDVHLESIVMVTGKVQKRPEGLINPKMLTGEIEVIANDFKVLNPCKETLPIHVHDFQPAKESLRMQYRYLDLRSNRMQRNLRLRSQVVMRMREFLCNHHGFVDVETPSLFRKTPGGAQEYLVPTHQPGKFYTLPQSPQQFKQLLMIGGIDRYFQIARCYRDEGSRPDRQPEFTQVDIEMSFVDKTNIYALIEGLLEYSWPADRPKLGVPFPRLSYLEAVDKYGSDKPDTRFDMKLCDITETLKGCSLSILASDEEGYTVKAINCKGAVDYFSNKDYENLQQEAMKHFKQGILIIKCKDDQIWTSPIAKHLSETTRLEIAQVLDASARDVLFVAAGARDDVCKVLGYVRLACADLLETKGVSVRGPGVYKFLWVEDFPLFLSNDEGASGELESSHHPFTAPIPQHTNLIYTDPHQVVGQHYDLVLNGSEIGGGSIRIHDAKLQEYVLGKILKKDASCLRHLLDALQSGCPPHGGIALGLDRLISIMCGEPSIRDVIAFPKTAEGNDPMSGAPSSVEDCDLDRYHIRVKEDSR